MNFLGKLVVWVYIVEHTAKMDNITMQQFVTIFSQLDWKVLRGMEKLQPVVRTMKSLLQSANITSSTFLFSLFCTQSQCV